MAKGLVTDTYLSNIADAIRTKNGTETQYKPSEMASAISSISTKTRPDYVSFYQYGGTSLDISWLDVSNITSMLSMFSTCSNLTTLDVGNWNTSNVTNMSYMFDGCSNLTTLDVGNWNTSNVTNMSYMFYNCAKLTSLNLANFNTNNVTNFDFMFAYCRQLATIDISSMNTPTKQGAMTFNRCGANLETPTIVYVKDETMQQWVLSTTGVPSTWSTSNVIIKEATT